MSFIPETSLGENSRIFVGDVSLLVVKGTLTENPQEIDTGANLTGGFTTRTRGRKNLELSVEAQWTVAENPVDDVGLFWLLPVFYVVSATVTIEGVGVVTYQIQIKNQGEYARPND